MTELRGNPYVGPRTFTREESDLFFGREREARELLSTVMSARLVLFYAQSGAGKSSLINARLIPQLVEEGFVVLPVGRVGGELREGVAEVDNLFVFNLLLNLDGSGQDAGRFAHVTLTDFLDRLTTMDGEHFFYDAAVTSTDETLPDKDGERDESGDAEVELYEEPSYVLIIDQFEEIVTQHPERWREREDFFRQLDRAMRDDPRLWVVLTLREDHVAALDPYASLLVDKLRVRFYMQRMGAKAALQAIKRPAERFGCSFAPGVAESLVENLRQAGQFVEPVQLQVVCYQLWKNVRSRPEAEITQDDLPRGYVDRALTNFYEDAVRVVVERTGVQEWRLRDWFDGGLITEGGTRATLFQGKTETGDLPNEAVDLLVDLRLLRPEDRAGGRWVELAHDRLMDPIIQANEDWRRRHPLIQAALEWREAGEPASKLYEGERLKAAWDDPDASVELVRTFLSAGRQAQEEREAAIRAEEQREAEIRAEEQARANRRLRWLVVGLTAVFVLAVGAAAFGWTQRQQARDAQERAETNATEIQRQVRLAHAGSLEAKVQDILDEDTLDEDTQLALLLALEAISATLTLDEAWVPAAETVLRQAVGVTGSLSVSGPEGDVVALAFSPDGRWLATGRSDGTLRLWRVADPQAEPVVWSGHEGAVTALAFGPDGSWLATGSSDSTARLWRVADPQAEPEDLSGHEESVSALAFSPDGSWLATGSSDNTARLWRVADAQAKRVLSGHKDAITVLAFSPDGSWLATGSNDRTVWLWRVADAQAEPKVLTGHEGDVVALAFSPKDGSWLATGSADGTARLWRAADSQPEPVILSGHEGAVTALVFSRDGRWLVTGSADRTARLLRVADPQAELKVLSGHEGTVNALAFSPDVRLLATGSSDGTARLWRVADPQAEPVVLRGQGGAVDALAFSPDGRWLAVVSAGGSARLWEMRLDALIDLACRKAERGLSWSEWKQYIYWEPYRKTCPNLPVDPSFIEVGRNLARKGNIRAASDHFRRVLELDPGLAFDPEEEARHYYAAPDLVQEGQSLAQQGDVEAAIAAYARAQEFDPDVKIDAEDWNSLCWNGSLNGYAAEVLFACEKANELASDDYRDSRGLARALTEDHVGAIEDFEFVVEQWQKQSVCGLGSVNQCTQLRDSIKVLEAGQNLDREEVLEALLLRLQVYSPEVGYLDLRQAPSASGSVLVQLPHAMLLESLEAPAVTLAKLGQQGQWLHVRTPDGPEGYVAASHLRLPRESEPDENRPVNPIVVTDDLSGLERSVAMLWNRQGGLLTDIAAQLRIESAAAVAVMGVEMGGRCFGPDGRMIIRFENHLFWNRWGEGNPDLFDQHFQFDRDRTWAGHEWRPSPDEDWRAVHGGHDSEWEAFNFARTLDEEAAMLSISMGGPQIMGFNHAALGYDSVQEMFDAFADSEGNQVVGFFYFLRSRGEEIEALRKLDFTRFARFYNGSGQAEYYGSLIRQAYDAYQRLRSVSFGVPFAPSAAAAPAPVGDADDLQRLLGIGPKTTARLEAEGINGFEHLAALDAEHLRGLLGSAARYARWLASWPAQARLADWGDWGALEAFQTQLRS